MANETQRRVRSARNLYPLIAKRLDSIPTLAAILGPVEAAARSEDQSTQEIAHLIKADPALTAKVLKVINSPFYGSQLNICTASHAAAMLGLPALRSLAHGIEVYPERPADEASLDWEKFWIHSLAVAVASQEVARLVSFDLPEEAYIGGLLHDIGKVVLDLYSPPEHRGELLSNFGDRGLSLGAERASLGTDHAQVGALVAEQWHLPRNLRDVIQFHHEPAERTRSFPAPHRALIGIVTLADRLCCREGYGLEFDPESMSEPLLLPDGSELGEVRIGEVVAEIEEAITGVLTRFGFDVSGANSLKVLQRESARARVGSKARPNGSDPRELIFSVAELVHEFRQVENPDAIVERALDGIQTGMDFDRLLFLQLDSEEGELRGRYLRDRTRLPVDPGTVGVPLNPDGLVGATLRQGIAQRVDNWATDGELLSLLGVVEVAVAPVIVNRQPVGVLCADYFFQNREISDTDVALLGILGTNLGLAVENRVLSRKAFRLKALASKDELTGIHNRRSLMRLLQNEVDRAKRYGSPLSVVMVDIDHFKPFNDTYGHQVGDTILAEVAQLIVKESRDIDIIGRYGGEEFLIALPETHADQGIVYAERLRASVDRYGVETQKLYPDISPITISAGVTVLQRGDDDIEQLIRRSDHALYAAKDRGRNRVCVD